MTSSKILRQLFRAKLLSHTKNLTGYWSTLDSSASRIIPPKKSANDRIIIGLKPEQTLQLLLDKQRNNNLTKSQDSALNSGINTRNHAGGKQKKEEAENKWTKRRNEALARKTKEEARSRNR